MFPVCVWVLCAQACLCTVYMSGALGDQKRVSDLLELEFQMVVRYYVGAGDGTGPVEEQPNFPVPSQSTF